MAMAPPRKGENWELRQQLNSEYRDKRADAIKRVIANHTIGKDCSGLFPDVVKNMQTDDLEQKKLVYLYLMNYAKTQPELVILAVNTFVKDTADPNPLVRALAIRTMSILRAEKILDYLASPLSRCLKDENPYVRKTAALCVAKVFDLKPELAIEYGFIETLRDLIGDGNPMVVANAVAALGDIHEASLNLPPPQPGSPNDDESPSSARPNQSLFIIDPPTLTKLLVALNECSEWGRIAILTTLARYRTNDEKESEHICERVMPQFQHVNAAVVLGAVKVIMIHMKNVTREDLLKSLTRKMAPPLVTLISSPPEVQWVALRNINLLLQKRPDILANEMRVFFCKYNDPSYVKVEKLEIMVRLANEKNVDTLLGELKEYASEVDVDFVRKAVRAVGQVAIKIDEAAGRCVSVLMELIETRVSYVVQEAVIVVKDIFRKYPHSYEGIIPALCANLEELDEPEAKASLIWLIGEYAEKIENADELLGAFLETFREESYTVQLQTLTAIVKLFLKKPDESQAIVQKVLQAATKDCDSPDVRDRAYIYWRLLSSDPAAAKSVVLSVRPPISLPQTTVSPAILEELIGEIATLASVYHKPAATFIGKGRLGADEMHKKSLDAEDDISREKALQAVVAGNQAENLLDFDDEPTPTNGESSIPAPGSGLGISSQAIASAAKSTNPLDELMDLFSTASMTTPVVQPGQPAAQAQASAQSSGGLGGLDGLAGLSSPPQSVSPQPAAPQNQQPQAAAQDDLLGLF
ncbi:clathrin binding protein [Cryptococcus neoformans C23]|uniref:AP complex subunit beta n=1 Tax=Cryptococcus neoformans (strain H99 / ATCC 208821 / CBS 10515 / FGSC 9487) TaxID=235443 RepID=J9VJV3_CRYN9|nr:clathrin binding protein [Cryptococcus neoformans var. grubii H99]AUB24166.1 clathrin binding protein [Cryptococcus neoformans var. grubii]OWZ32861.1 clathrin binding protein [Cryptococcus neoformans var. grubii AD2-60a]OWZ45155.1 clathrin binding protein [Cryptococcus neoformans var. grubii C23]OXG35072.1 clathrin binding protein [Cryptococcus neoformans var. grubii Bt15]OXG43002.1 clathrin binding protein [Cryptococcus neoformans var. grubii Bt120]|eukprot:XP_012048555.1 clathrin binding protein [Cryptococcus neoformans var. grubii H99]